MRTTTKICAVIASTATALSIATTTPALAGPSRTSGHSPGGSIKGAPRHSAGRLPHGRAPHHSRGHASRYPDVFAQAGYTDRQVKRRLEATWKQLFHGSPGTDPNRYDGQSIYYQLSPDMAYVEDIGNQDVRTEGMGYAMMIALQLGHEKEFDDLWNFAKTKMQIQSGPEQYYFAWHTRTDGSIIDTGVAPDGDQWIPAALAEASARWGDGRGIYAYRTQARQILHAMWHASDNGGVDMFSATSYLPVFSPPFAVGYSDASYALPAFYRVFAKVDPADRAQWHSATEAGEQMLQKAHDPATGLAPCYSNFDGTPYMRPGETATDNAYDHNFQEDAWRVIANANVDASWWGTQRWQTTYSNTLESFFRGQGISTYVSRYHLDGTPLTSGQNTYEPTHAEGLVAMNSTSAITATTPYRDKFVADLWNTPVPSGRARYYDGMLYLLGLLYDSGTFKNWMAEHPSHRH